MTDLVTPDDFDRMTMTPFTHEGESVYLLRFWRGTLAVDAVLDEPHPPQELLAVYAEKARYAFAHQKKVPV